VEDVRDPYQGMPADLERALRELEAALDRGEISYFEYRRRCAAIESWLCEHGVVLRPAGTLVRR
jgi:hypothetical protein